MISQRTKEALQRKKRDGEKLGRPKGSLSDKTKLTRKEEIIQDLINKKISVNAMGRILGAHRTTVDAFIKSRRLNGITPLL